LGILHRLRGQYAATHWDYKLDYERSAETREQVLQTPRIIECAGSFHDAGLPFFGFLQAKDITLAVFPWTISAGPPSSCPEPLRPAVNAVNA
jgi:hypothetical protein